MNGDDLNESDVDSDNYSDTADGELSADKLDPADRELYDKLKQQELEERQEIERELKAHEEALARHQEELRLREKELHLAQERMQQRERDNASSNNGKGDCGASSGILSNGLCGNGSVSIHNSSSGNTNSGISSKHIPGADDLRAHIHAAQLAALTHVAALPHLGHLAHHRDLKLDGHPFRAAGLIPNHSPFSQTGGSGSSPDRFPPRPSSQTPHPPSSVQSSPEASSDGRTHHWTFEEQFKQVRLQFYFIHLCTQTSEIAISRTECPFVSLFESKSLTIYTWFNLKGRQMSSLLTVRKQITKNLYVV